jgi:membrane-bound inhibitor of C-type lysozyme
MQTMSKKLIKTGSKGLASLAVLLSVASLVACSSQPSQPSSPNLPAPRPVATTATPPAQQSAPQSTPQPPVVQAPAQTAPIATGTGPAPTMSIDTGLYRCELGVRVTVKKIAPDKSSMILNWKNKDYTLAAVSSQSGALRFEDKANGLVWMAIVGKSQLLNSKVGQRLANDCNL